MSSFNKILVYSYYLLTKFEVIYYAHLDVYSLPKCYSLIF